MTILWGSRKNEGACLDDMNGNCCLLIYFLITMYLKSSIWFTSKVQRSVYMSLSYNCRQKSSKESKSCLTTSLEFNEGSLESCTGKYTQTGHGLKKSVLDHLLRCSLKFLWFVSLEPQKCRIFGPLLSTFKFSQQILKHHISTQPRSETQKKSEVYTNKQKFIHWQTFFFIEFIGFI